MKICYIASLGSNHTEHWIKYFTDVGHEVHLITSNKPSDGSLDNVTIHRLKRFGPRIRILSYLINLVPKVIQFRRLIKSIKPDIIHAHSIMEISLLGTFIKSCPFVVTVWGSDVLIAPKESMISRWYVKLVLKRADLITCGAEHTKGPIIELGAAPQRICVALYGTDVTKFTPGRRSNIIRKELEVFDCQLIISTRRLEPIYDIETFIKAVPLVLEDFPKTKFVIGSKGSQLNYLKQLAYSLGVQASTRFVGYVPDDELPAYLASSDICVSTSLQDAGLSGSTAEAMACGLPVIVTDFVDNSKWIEDGVNGLIIPLKSPEQLAEKIIYLLKNENKRKEFGKINRQIIKNRDNWETEMSKMEVLYKELAGNPL